MSYPPKERHYLDDKEYIFQFAKKMVANVDYFLGKKNIKSGSEIRIE